jgi:hypothetical protein
MPRLTPPDDDPRLGRAWTAFVADDAAARPPAGLEARVLRAAQAARAEQRRTDADRRRHHWMAGVATLAASALAAAAWSLIPHDAPAPTVAAPTVAATPQAATPVAAATDGRRAGRSRPMPMTNVEAGRVLASVPEHALAARPILQPIDALVATPGAPRAKSFYAPAPAAKANPVAPQLAQVPAAVAPDTPAQPGALPGPLGVMPTRPAPEVWSSRGFQGVFDPAAPPAPGYRLDLATPAPAPVPEEPPPQ